MTRPLALRVALDLAKAPVLARLAAKQSLPPGMTAVLQIAGGDAAALDAAVAVTGEAPETIRRAAVLFLEAVLFTPTADSYRLLGAERASTQAELRDHMRWLMKWLHPDRERSEWQSALATRISAAWDDLKTPERRQAYDEAHPAPPGAARRGRPTRIPWIGVATAPADGAPRGWILARAALLILVGVAVVAALLTDGTTSLFSAILPDSHAGARR
jgi:hypothetical protein